MQSVCSRKGNVLALLVLLKTNKYNNFKPLQKTTEEKLEDYLSWLNENYSLSTNNNPVDFAYYINYYTHFLSAIFKAFKKENIHPKLFNKWLSGHDYNEELIQAISEKVDQYEYSAISKYL